MTIMLDALEKAGFVTKNDAKEVKKKFLIKTQKEFSCKKPYSANCKKKKR